MTCGCAVLPLPPLIRSAVLFVAAAAALPAQVESTADLPASLPVVWQYSTSGDAGGHCIASSPQWYLQASSGNPSSFFAQLKLVQAVPRLWSPVSTDTFHVRTLDPAGYASQPEPLDSSPRRPEPRWSANYSFAASFTVAGQLGVRSETWTLPIVTRELPPEDPRVRSYLLVPDDILALLPTIEALVLTWRSRPYLRTTTQYHVALTGLAASIRSVRNCDLSPSGGNLPLPPSPNPTPPPGPTPTPDPTPDPNPNPVFPPDVPQ